MDELFKLIDFIINEHEKFSKVFFHKQKFNLKKTQVCDVISENHQPNGEFLVLLSDYRKSVDTSYTQENFDKLGIRISNNNPRMRVKVQDSITNKLAYYLLKKERGEFPINKVLNDILGFRFIMASDETYQQIEMQIRQHYLKAGKLFRIYQRNEENYHALHLHFKSQCNYYFPWELQIWRHQDSVANELSHKKHKEKRAYVIWTEIHEEGR